MPRTVLITGCSDGGLGAALAMAFHKHGDRVIATARNPKKMSSLTALGIETLRLDVTSDESVKAAVEETSKLLGGSLDILLNNAGTGYSTPFLDAAIPEVAKLFDLNVLGCLRVSQAFFPLLRNAKNGALLVNNTSVASVIAVPFQGPYSMSKAAQGSMTEAMRLELQPFNIKVIDLKTATVRTNFFNNTTSSGSSEFGQIHLPENSLYAVARVPVEKFMRTENEKIEYMNADKWAELVVKDLSRKKVPWHIWHGGQAWGSWMGSLLPVGWADWLIKQMTGLDLVEKHYQPTWGGKS
jgi:1-acylglycerone phosphate reductase